MRFEMGKDARIAQIRASGSRELPPGGISMNIFLLEKNNFWQKKYSLIELFDIRFS